MKGEAVFDSFDNNQIIIIFSRSLTTGKHGKFPVLLPVLSRASIDARASIVQTRVQESGVET